MSHKNNKQELEESTVYLGYIENNDRIDHELILDDMLQNDDSLKTTTNNSNTIEPWLVNKIGGSPIFPYNSIDIDELESALESLRCKHCKSECMLVFQINSPIDDLPVDRVLQVYACVKNDCSRHSWFSMRCMFKKTSNKEAKIMKSESENLKLVNDKVYGSVVICQQKTFFEPHFVSVIEEPTGRENFAKNNLEALKLASKYTDPDLKPAPIEAKYKNLKNYKPPQPPASLNDLDDFEKFQLENLYRGDKDMYRYYKRLARYQAQVVRYDWEGEPLLNSNKIKFQIQNCPTCSAKRKFEFQLMSTLINYLKPLSETTQFDRESLDFSSIITHSCSKNCCSNAFNLEDTYFMPDPDSRVFNKIKQRMLALKLKKGGDVDGGVTSSNNDAEKSSLATDEQVDTTVEVEKAKAMGSSSSTNTKKKKKNKKK